VDKSMIAGALGLGAVILFMFFNYRFPGLVADAALIIYTLMTLAIFKLIPVTLTVPGIAGFILSIGMAVDANILIFERTKEELREGRSIFNALETGFDRAFSSIFDSNMTTLISCAVLFYFGTGLIRGFALTLGIGVLVSMFTAITVTRTFLRTLITFKKFKNPALFGIKPVTRQSTTSTSTPTA
jgi:protein-export membrane protein SecD